MCCGPVSVRPSVRHKAVCTKIAKYRITQTTLHNSPGLYFLKPIKDVGENRMGPSPKGAQIPVEWVKIVDFRPISRYISETVQDRDILRKANRNSYALRRLSNGAVSNDHQ